MKRERPHMDFLIERGFLPQGGYALDLGSGCGHDARILSQYGYHVTAVDRDATKISCYPKTYISDIRHFVIEKEKYTFILCNNVLPFIENKEDVREIVRKVIDGLRIGGVAYITFYGKNSHFATRKDSLMTFFDYAEAEELCADLPVAICEKTTRQGNHTNREGEVFYQHTHRFILKKL